MSGEKMEEVNEIQLKLSALGEKLEELLFFEALPKTGKFKPKEEKKQLEKLLEGEKIGQAAFESLSAMAKEKKLDSEKKTLKESIEMFIKAFNSFSKLSKERGVGLGFIALSEEKKGKSPFSFLKKESKPAPKAGGKRLSDKILSVFIASKKTGGVEEIRGGEEPKKEAKKPSPFAKIAEKAAKGIKSVKKSFKGTGMAKKINIQDVFKVPVFATGSGLTEKTTKEDYGKTSSEGESESKTIVSLKEQLFEEGKKTEVAQTEKNITTLIPGYAYGKMMAQKNGTHVYFVIEPDLSEDEREKIEKIKNELIEVITIEELSREKMFKKVEEIINKRGYTFSKQGRHKLMYYLSRDLLGLERIEPLMHDPLIEDIECDGVEVPIYVVHQREGHVPTNIVFKSLENLEDYIIKLAQLSKTYVSYASPLVDSILPDGSRVNAVLSKSVSTKGPSFTIRLFPEKPLPPTTLIKNGTITARIMAYLWTVLEYKKSMLITGPTASGKTTILNAVAMCLPYGDRVVSIEDTRELNIKHENWLPQVARKGFGPPNASGKKFGEVNMMTLIRESFRQRPDYLIVGEVRGKECFVLFQGMASGHCSIATFHARSVEDVVSRLTTPPINLYPGLLESVDVILNLGFSGEREIKRRIRAVAEVKSYNITTRKLEYNDLMESSLEEIRGKSGKMENIASFFPLTGRSYLLKEISKEYNIPLLELQKKIEKRTAFLKRLSKDEGIEGYEEFSERLSEFKDAEGQNK